MPELAVLDTNVWLDWLVFDDPGVARLREAVGSGRLVLVASDWMRGELASVLGRAQIVARRPDAAARIDAFDAAVTLRDAAPRCRLVCTDPADQAFLDLATHEGAHWLITKDRALLRLARRARSTHGLGILTPAAFLAAYNWREPDTRCP